MQLIIIINYYYKLFWCNQFSYAGDEVVGCERIYFTSA